MEPWPGIESLEVAFKVRDGTKPQVPENCPLKLKPLFLKVRIPIFLSFQFPKMHDQKKKKKCWEFNPENRPTFKEILNELTAYQREEEELQGNNVTRVGSTQNYLHFQNPAVSLENFYQSANNHHSYQRTPSERQLPRLSQNSTDQNAYQATNPPSHWQPPQQSSNSSSGQYAQTSQSPSVYQSSNPFQPVQRSASYEEYYQTTSPKKTEDSNYNTIE